MPDTHLAAPPPAAPTPPPDPKARASTSPFAALRHRDFRLLWAGQFVSITGSQMQLVAISWHVYLLTKSSVALGPFAASTVIMYRRH